MTTGTDVASGKAELVVELTLLRVPNMTPGAGTTTGKAELTTEPILLATLETESWRDDPTDEGEAIAELMLPKTGW
jgi:hypothetical protein